MAPTVPWPACCWPSSSTRRRPWPRPARARRRSTRSRRVLTACAPDEVATVVCLLTGRAPPGPHRRRLGDALHGARRRCRDPPRPRATVTVADLDAGARPHRRDHRPGIGRARARRSSATCSRARPPAEADFVVRLLTGELRQGALAGLMADAIARAAEVPADAVRRAAMLGGDLADTARRALDRRRGRAGRGRARSAAAGAADARRERGHRRRRARRDRDRRRSSGSSTARASRCTAPATRCACSPATSTTSPRACPRSSRSRARFAARSFVLDGEAIGLDRRRAPPPLPGHDEPLRHRRRDESRHDARRRSSSTCSTSTATTCSTGRSRERAAILARARRRVARPGDRDRRPGRRPRRSSPTRSRPGTRA